MNKEVSRGSLKRILLVEDSLRDAELTLHALADYNLANSVLHLRDGSEALDYLYRRSEYSKEVKGNPAVILLDLKMPKVDGLEVLQQIRREPALSTIPVVIMTSSREDRDLQAAYRLGANAYVVKPMQFKDFVDAVKQVGAFWAILNEAPPGSVSSGVRPHHSSRGPSDPDNA
ncbi:MAG: response regulator [Casimicrobiaceae bacterium]